MNPLRQTQEQNSANTSDQNNVQTLPQTIPIHRITEKEPLDGNTVPSESLSQPSEALVEMGNLLTKATPPPTTEVSASSIKAKDTPKDPKTSLASTTLAAPNANGIPPQTDSNDSEAPTPALSLPVTVPSLPPIKRKSPRGDSTNNTEPESTGKKRKIDEKDSSNIPIASPAHKLPIPSFSTPPGQKVNTTTTKDVEMEQAPPYLVTGVELAPTTTTAPSKSSNEDFVTIKIGPIEANPEKKVNGETIDFTESNDQNETKNKAKESSPSTTTASTNKPAATTSSSAAMEKSDTSAETIVNQYTTLSPLKGVKEVRPLRSLSTSERIQLERLFEFDKRKENGKTWDDDWFGVLDLCHLEVQNPDARAGERQKKRSLLEWVGLNSNVGGGKKKTTKTNNSLKLLNNLLRYVYNYKKVPEQAKLILANIDTKDPASIGSAIERISIDPIVLNQDGWTIAKAKEPQGASGGAYRIGEKIWWQGYLGVVIAFVHDEDMGDLWKALWVEDLATFDLEREELEDARKKYERKKAASTEKKKKQQLIHETLRNDFTVAGIEHGIVLATSYARGARHGVFWPARVLHASELVGTTGRRSKSKKKVDVVFLAPYWNSDQALGTNGARRTEPFSGSIARHGESIFSSGPMFEVESIDATESCIQSYPYDAEIGLDIDSLRTTFKFLGLPKAAFSRFLDSQRMAIGFKTYSQKALKSTLASDSDRTSAALLEGHPLSVQAPLFPPSVLQLPFVHILSELPHHERQSSSQSFSDTAKAEPPLRFDRILEAMKPPICWGQEPSASAPAVQETPQFKSILASPMTFLDKDNGTKDDPYNTGRFLIGLLSLQSLLSDDTPTSRMLKYSLNELVSTFAKSSSLQNLQKSESRKRHIKSLNKAWVVVKVSLWRISSSRERGITLGEFS